MVVTLRKLYCFFRCDSLVTVVDSWLHKLTNLQKGWHEYDLWFEDAVNQITDLEARIRSSVPSPTTEQMFKVQLG